MHCLNSRPSFMSNLIFGFCKFNSSQSTIECPVWGVTMYIPHSRESMSYFYTLGIPSRAKQMNPSCTCILSLDGPLKGLYFLYHFKSLKKKDGHYCWVIGKKCWKKSSKKLMTLKVVIFCFHLIISQFITLITRSVMPGQDEALIIYYFAPTGPWFFSSVIKEEKKTEVHQIPWLFS